MAVIDLEVGTRHLAKADKLLGRVIAEVGPCRLLVEDLGSPFAALGEAIVYQQLTGKAAATIVGRLKALYGDNDEFPTPREIADSEDARLRQAGLSGNKVAALKDLAKRTLDGTLPDMEALEAMDDDEIVASLTAVRGIGRWTVEMLLIFRMGRPDVLPATDYGVRKGFARTFRRRELPAPSEITLRAERWRPFRSVASWYLWRCLELPVS